MSDKQNNSELNPGSEEAQAKGCLCPVIDNEYGKGYFGVKGVFVINEGCPIHGNTNEGIDKKQD